MAEFPLVSVIEESGLVRRRVAALVRSVGFSVEVFGSAEEFVRSNQLPCTACLIINVQLAGMSGLQLQSHLASSGRHIPMVFITASQEEKAQAKARQMGAVNLLYTQAGDKALVKEVCSILKPASK